ncbi:MAG: hypothetical protein B7Z16_07415 [Algoriphagus sp. 32-45-6]|nr:MAG: hypothetical protein B7Z16_07415 [Algoriphagus sp. 32-45-6]
MSKKFMIEDKSSLSLLGKINFNSLMVQNDRWKKAFTIKKLRLGKFYELKITLIFSPKEWKFLILSIFLMVHNHTEKVILGNTLPPPRISV